MKGFAVPPGPSELVWRRTGHGGGEERVMHSQGMGRKKSGRGTRGQGPVRTKPLTLCLQMALWTGN